MKTCRAFVLLACSLTLLSPSRGRADDKDDLKRILAEVAELPSTQRAREAYEQAKQRQREYL